MPSNCVSCGAELLSHEIPDGVCGNCRARGVPPDPDGPARAAFGGWRDELDVSVPGLRVWGSFQTGLRCVFWAVLLSILLGLCLGLADVGLDARHDREASAATALLRLAGNGTVT